MSADLLSVHAVHSGYRRLAVLHGVDLAVPAGGWVSVLGANGAGKSTLLRTLSGLLPVNSGRVLLDGWSVAGRRCEEIAARGLGHVPENRLVFARCTVAENLWLGGYLGRKDRRRAAGRADQVYDLFPALADRRAQLAGTLSGGEQQMLAVGRALMAGPRVLMLDEPSVGLAPRVVHDLFEALARLRAETGLSLLLVEQNAAMALRYSDYAYVLDRGRVALRGTAAQLREDPGVRDAYLGLK
jgi:branched-chain amino acid transport system ATP-binding protein